MSSKKVALLLAGLSIVVPAWAQTSGASPAASKAAETFEPELFELAGQVFLGDEPHAAKLEFLLGEGSKLEVRSDAAGHYRVETRDVLRKVEIELAGREAFPFHEFFAKDVRREGVRDFHLPATELAIKVVDAETGKAVPGASVMVRNRFPARDREGKVVPPRHPGEPAPTTSLMQSVETDAAGAAKVYYLVPGQVELAGKADGYAKSAERLQLELAENGRLTAELRLQPFSRVAGLRIRLPGGGKASGANVLLLESLDPFNAITAATADAEGRVALPIENAGALLTIRHQGAAFLIGKWQPAEGNGQPEPEIELAPAAPLKVTARSGEKEIPFAEVILWVGGRRLSGQILFQLTGVAPMTNGDGDYGVFSLPRQDVKLLVFSRQDAGKAAAARGGQLDGQAVEIPYPWPAKVEVQGIE